MDFGNYFFFVNLTKKKLYFLDLIKRKLRNELWIFFYFLRENPKNIKQSNNRANDIKTGTIIANVKYIFVSSGSSCWLCDLWLGFTMIIGSWFWLANRELIQKNMKIKVFIIFFLFSFFCFFIYSFFEI